MADDARSLLERAREMRERALTPEQAEYRRWVNARNKAIQGRVRAPASGTFGLGKKP